MNAHSFNLARRLTEKNEPDLLLEDYSRSHKDTGDNGGDYSEKFCQKLVDKVCPDKPLPNECKQYPTVVSKLKRRNSDKSDHAKAFAGMGPGEAAAAMAARERGQLHHAQIQRRLTTRRK